MKLLEDNYNTYCALNSIVRCSSDASFGPHTFALQQVDPSLNIKEKVVGLLEKNEFADKRSAKLDMDDFLRYSLCCGCTNGGLIFFSFLSRLLDVFNKEGIHFC